MSKVLTIASFVFNLFIITCCSQNDNIKLHKGFINISFTNSEQAKSRINSNPSSILITIKDAEGNTIFDLKKLQLTKIGNEYISSEVEFVEGNFTIEEFIVINENDSALYITPKYGSKFDQLVDIPLPYSFTVEGNKSSNISLEVISTSYGKAIQFGYSTFSFNIVETLGKGLVLHYPFDGNSFDMSYNQLHATIYEATLTTDRFNRENKAYYFDGINDKITGSVNNMDIGDQLSISVWINSTDTSRAHIVSKYDWKQDAGFALRLLEGIPYIDGRDGSNHFWRSGDNSVKVNDGQWHHLLATIHKNSWALYVDGEIVSRVSTVANNVNFQNQQPLSVGYYHQGSEGNYRYFKGQIDEVRIYNRELTPYEISLLADEIN